MINVKFGSMSVNNVFKAEEYPNATVGDVYNEFVEVLALPERSKIRVLGNGEELSFNERLSNYDFDVEIEFVKRAGEKA